MHMKSVTSEKHQFFAFENEMSEYIVSGLSGDNINASLKKSVANFLNVTCTKDDLTNEVINTVAPIEVATKEDLVNEKMRASISMAKRLNREREMNDIASKICLIQ
ncbi:hypothetical protein A3Q56_00441 [Intoshia linei]|uniref:Uncharacterized protein n=1 Tax=Intoshia linei TaxID=1819745 RepID=A0A177BE01_9BILA|nr:hypothetical protein A3Q56_00441 [Intoshia linei]